MDSERLPLENVTFDMIQHNDDAMRAISLHAITQLLLLPIRLNSPEAIEGRIVPELLQYDVNRLAMARDIIDKISLQAVLIIITRQIIAKIQKFIPSKVINHTSGKVFIKSIYTYN